MAAAGELPFERIKLIDQSTKDTVFGWFKNVQQTILPQNDTYYIIPVGINIICLLFYSPCFQHGTYEIEGSDESASKHVFKAKYCLEFCPDGTIFGTRGKQIICGGWSPDNHSLNFMLTWMGTCYQYHGTVDTILRQITGDWHIKDEEKKEKKGQHGTFQYKYTYKSEVSKVELTVNNVTHSKLQNEYETLLEKYEAMKKQTNEVILAQDAEIFALRLLLVAQKREIDEYKAQITGTQRHHSDDDKDEEKRDPSEYLQWSWKEILEWIMTLEHGKYSKYYDALSQQLCDEQLTGDLLRYVDKNDLHRFGVIHYVDKVGILESIQKLIRSKEESSSDRQRSDENENNSDDNTPDESSEESQTDNDPQSNDPNSDDANVEKDTTPSF